MESFLWTCPFCGRDASITDDRHSKNKHFLTIDNTEGTVGLETIFIVCPNERCRKYALIARLHTCTKEFHPNYGPYWEFDKIITEWDIIPPARVKQFPSYIPAPIIDDYKEACLICKLSPKASATLSRRCLQGMIRDFWGIVRKRLIDEIKAIKDKCDSPTWDAIDAVRKVGNIGAHMEQDINMIVEIEPNEAELLMRLIEHLLKEWYVGRYQKEEMLKSIVELGKKKETKTE